MKIVDIPKGVRPADCFKDRPDAVAAWLTGSKRAVDFGVPVSEDTGAEPLAFADPVGREVFWHSGSHLLAQAVKELYPDAKLAIGPAVEEGFYYDIDRETPFAVGDLPQIEERMREIVKRDLPVVRRDLPREEARKLFESRGEIYKVEMIDALPDPTVSVYEQGDFVDMCRGPHVPRTGMLAAVKLFSVAGAYWRADERNRQLSRIYGVAFPTDEGLKEHLRLLAEAEKRDHRRLGRELDLVSFHEEGGPGLAYWHPKGAMVRRVIEDFWRQEHEKAGYDLVFSPHIGKAQLWETSGHLSFYKDSIPGPSDQVMRAGYGVPVRAVGDPPGTAPGARIHPGRRAHLHAARPAGGRAGQGGRVRPVHADELRIREIQDVPLDPSRGFHRHR